MSTFVLQKKYLLQLPNSFVNVDSDEMEYVDGGGWSISTFKQSWDNLAKIYVEHFGSQAFRYAGGGIAISLAWTYWTTVTTVGATVAGLVGTAAAAITGPLAIPLSIAAGLGTAALVTWMGTGVRFS